MREDTDVKRQSERDQRWEPGEDTDTPVKALEDTPLKTQRWEAHENTGGGEKGRPAEAKDPAKAQREEKLEDPKREKERARARERERTGESHFCPHRR